MALSTEAKRRLKVALTDETVGTEVADAIDAGANKQGVAVDDAAGAAPTAAEFKALLDSLRDAGLIAS